MKTKISEALRQIKLFNCILILAGSGILAFGIYNIHSLSGVTEGGVLGLMLLLQHWLSISPAISGIIMNVICYGLGWKFLGKMFIVYSFISNIAFSAFYAVFELFPPVYPEIAEMPLLASIAGAVFVGIGAGLCIKAGAATSGDDALAMSISSVAHTDIRWIYLASDLTVLALSLTYIPPVRIVYSLITVILSGQIIGCIQKLGKGKSNK